MDKKLYKILRDGTKVYIVDGAYVRKNLNNEFTNFAEHYRFPKIIPKDEFWLDQCHGHDEYGYYIEHMAMECALMKKGKSWDYAYDTSSKYEEALRHKAPRQSLKKKLLTTLDDGVNIYLVNGEQVRKQYDVDFTQGGHDLVYKYIPKNEVWIDDSLMSKERDEVQLHEIRERASMSNQIPYISAHNGASRVEKTYRKGGKKALSVRDKEILASISKAR